MHLYIVTQKYREKSCCREWTWTNRQFNSFDFKKNGYLTIVSEVFFKKRMFKIIVAIGLFGTITCRMLTQASYMESNFEINKVYPVVPRPPLKYSELRDIQGKSYMSGYGTSITPTYYPAFDPLSVLASLAFLAFLLQSFASLLKYSRSITPTTVTARQFMELKMLALTTQIVQALEKYEKNHNQGILVNTKRKRR